MRQKTGLLLFSCILMLFSLPVSAQDDLAFDRYHSPEQLENIIRTLGERDRAQVIELAETPGGNKLLILKIGPETGNEKTLPAVITAANMEGTSPLATEAALYLAAELLRNAEMHRDKTWYILPCGNPDALARFFADPLFADARNAEPYNDDMDDAIDEDGVDDLNRDGIISMMRFRDPEGEWIEVPGEPRLMKRAEPEKGETGTFRLLSEGLDNDGDGRYNEDGPGGTNVGINFPHGFEYWTSDAGTWPGSSPEANAVLEFVYAHPEIAMAVTYGSSNFCLSPPRTDRKGGNDMERLRIPERYGRRLGLDTGRTYTFEEARNALQEAMPEGTELTDARVASILGLKAEANPMPKDMAFYRKISADYLEFLESKGLSTDRIPPADDKDGSFELLAYYHLGIPSFALDFWTPPIDRSATDPDGGNSGRNDRPQKQGSAKNENPEIKFGKAFLEYSDTMLNGEGFLEWTPFQHPELGEVEIGGMVPFADNTPPAGEIQGFLSAQVPWAFELASMLPRITIGDITVEDLGSGIFRIEAIVENEGSLPYPIAMGSRNGRIIPVILELESDEITVLEGRERTRIPGVPGNGAARATWLVHAASPRQITIKSQTMNAWSDEKTITLGGAK